MSVPDSQLEAGTPSFGKQSPMSDFERAVSGCLIGTAVGDAFGLPCEGLSRRRAQSLFPDMSGYRFLFGRGMVSDDTQHRRRGLPAAVYAVPFRNLIFLATVLAHGSRRLLAPY